MSKTSTQPAKGTRDFLPLELRRRKHVTDIIRDVFERHGFEPLETPALERLDALLGKYGEEGDQLLFKVLLRGAPLVEGVRKAADFIAVPSHLVEGRSGVTAPGAEPMLSDLGLRYDLTVPFARVYAAHQNELGAVWKRYQMQPVWRADTPGKGRYREFYQCDVDVVGSTSRVVEAEIAGAAAQCMRTLGFTQFDIRINHRGLLRALIEHAGIAPERETSAIVAIDKLDKLGLDGVTRDLLAHGIPQEAAGRLLDLLGPQADLAYLEKSLADHQAGMRALQNIREVFAFARGGDAEPHLRFDVSLARGLGYYTGCIFEIAVKDLAGSLGGGGRYDGLIGMFSGRDVPACGFSLGLERILIVMAEREMFPASLARLDVVLSVVSDDKLADALRLSRELRAQGLFVDLRPNGMKPGKLRQYAEGRGARSAVWIENEHVDQASVWLRGEDSVHKDVPATRIGELLRGAVEGGS